MLEAGIKGVITRTVTDRDTAAVHKSGTLQVLATPAMVALMEETAWTSVAEALQPGEATVGTALELKHLAPTPVGMEIRCETTLTEVDRRRLVFEAVVYDGKEKIGEGRHERFIIQGEKFQQKADAKND